MPGSDPRSNDLQRMLWIDGVGAYLVSLADEWILGQATSPRPDVALMADLSRRHARVRRESGGYLLMPYGPTRVNGRIVEGEMLLAAGDEIALGDSVRIRFERPHALSSTALLRVVSGHRTAPAADAIVLMAESCVLGAKRHSHIRCPGWTEEWILFRGSEGLLARSSAPIGHNGVEVSGPVPLQNFSRLTGQDCSLSVEEVVSDSPDRGRKAP